MPVRPCRPDDSGLRRRDLLLSAPWATLGLPALVAQTAQGRVPTFDRNASCIFLMLVGGPSQLDTFDLKPDAPREIRSPFRPITTNIPGIEISEIFPKTARHADKFAIVRSMHHSAFPIHEEGCQLVQTGRTFDDGVEYPHIGCVLSRLEGSRPEAPFHVLLPGPMSLTGNATASGQSAGYLGRSYDPHSFSADPNLVAQLKRKTRQASDLRLEPDAVRERYGLNAFGQNCLHARRLVEAGTRFVTVNMFQTVFNQMTWDGHGSQPFSPMDAYKGHVGPMFDMAYSSLLQDLSDRGLLKSTMVVATGEFGRTPRINLAGGRDHWPHCWSLLMAGGGISGGQVIGASDETASYPRDRPTNPQEVIATIYRHFGVDSTYGVDGLSGFRIDSEPIKELFS